MPFAEAGELGTRKVMLDHSTIGIVVTTDGSVTDFGRNDYISAEERIVEEMKSTGKPFIILLNSRTPNDSATQKLVSEMCAKYNVSVVAKNVAEMNEMDIQELLASILGEFPLRMIGVKMPRWMQMLQADNELIIKVMANIANIVVDVGKMRDYDKFKDIFLDDSDFNKTDNVEVKFDDGSIVLNLMPKEELFYKVLSDCCGVNVRDESALFGYIKNATTAIKTFDKMNSALQSVEQCGYGVVMPKDDEIEFAKPEFEGANGRRNIKMTASCSCLHIMKVDVQTSVNPIVASGTQAQDMVNYLENEYKDDLKQIWNTNMLGKKLADIAKDGLSAKMFSMPQEAQKKLRKAVCRIVNEGKGGVLCVLL